MSDLALASSAQAPSAEAVYALRTVLATLILTVGFVSLTPYASIYTGDAGGNILNQLGYGLLALISLVGHLVFTERRVARALLRPSWVLLLGWFALSSLQTADPADTFRGVVFAGISMLAVTGALCLPPDGRSLRVPRGRAVMTARVMSDARGVNWPSLGRPVGDVDCLVRLSKGIGTPRGLPDLLGLAVRLLHAPPVDVLATSAPGGSRWGSRS